MKRLRFVIDITANDESESYKHLAWVLEDGIRKMQTDLVNHVFFIGNATVLRRLPKEAR